MEGKRSKMTSKDRSFLILQFHFVHCIRASVYESARLVPSVMTRLQQLLLAKELNENLFAGAVDEEQILAALTAPVARPATSYERLEYLGDKFLKAITDAYAFAKSDERMEGFLHLD